MSARNVLQSLTQSFADVSEARRRNMSAIKGKHTKPEIAVRSLLHRLGYRFRLHRSDLPGRPDIAFSARKAVIEVQGCFWHRHPDPSCRNAVLPKSRREFWESKLARNVERDANNIQKLSAMGWRTLVVWECQTRDSLALAEMLAEFLGPATIKRDTKRRADFP